MKTNEEKIKNHILKVELRRAFQNPRWILIVLVGVVLFIIGKTRFSQITVTGEYAINTTNRLMLAMHYSELAFIVPLLVLIPYADSLLNDIQSRAIDFLVFRSGRKDYLRSKLLAIVLSGGICLVVVLLVMVLSSSVYGINFKSGIYATGMVNETEPFGPFSALFMTKPALYLVYLFVSAFLFGITYSLFGTAMSVIFKNKFIGFSVPLFLFQIVDFIGVSMNPRPWYLIPLRGLMPFNAACKVGDHDLLLQLLQYLIVLLPSLIIIGLIMKSYEKNREENKLSAFFAFTRNQIYSQIKRNRWLLPIVLGLLNGLRNATILQGDPELHIMKSANVWDVIFSSLGHTHFVHLVILTTFLYLIGDLLPEKSYGQLMLFRLQSRRKWWLSKMLTLLTLTAIYVVLFIAPMALVGGLAHGWSLDYSEQTFFNRFISGVPANLFFTGEAYITPLDLFAQTLLLIFLALFTCGLFATVITLFTSRSLFGLTGGFTFVFVSLIGNSLSGPPTWVKFLPSYHVAYLGILPVRTIPVPISVLYWIIWICLLVSLGFFRSLKQNIFSVAKE